jgi:4-amino-4-deoxy-L-arabinose transferase-like glycosyltransferase
LTTRPLGVDHLLNNYRPSRNGWAIILLVVVAAAAALRFWSLGDHPAGLYRDEAVNGLDALEVLAGERDGQSLIYFEANNGREPAYIYLTTLTVALFGRTALALRLTAAIISTLTTLLVFALGRAWFGRRVGMLAAWFWAATVWPIHLGRIGLRPVLLPFMLAVAFWLATIAYRRTAAGGRSPWPWVAAGLAYGAAFYTYLAVRLTPLLLLLVILYLVLTGRGRRLWPGLGWAGVAAGIVVAPLAALAWRQPELVLGRLEQVSVLNPAISQGLLPAALWERTWQALGMFVVRGDDIIRHNPPGRPVFDVFMAGPLLIGVGWAAANWRRPAAMTVLLWSGVMLAPTILAEDTPHFLRAVGVLPAAIMLPAAGLSQLWTWSKLPAHLGPALVAGLIVASLMLTLTDYFGRYRRAPATAYWFEAAARDLAERVNGESPGTDTAVDLRFWESFPSVRFLLNPSAGVQLYEGPLPPAQLALPAALYAWPYESLERVTKALPAPAEVAAEVGSLAQGDRDPEPYPLYVRYTAAPAAVRPVLATFGGALQLRGADVQVIGPQRIQVELYWSPTGATAPQLAAFVHAAGPQGTLGQSDHLPADGFWPVAWWRPGQVVRDRHVLDLSAPWDGTVHQLAVGWYDAQSGDRLPVADATGEPAGDSWSLAFDTEN